MNPSKLTIAAMLLCALAGCNKPDDKRIGPAEQAGREIDKATERAAIQIDRANDQLADAAKESGSKLNKAAGEAGDKLNKAAEVVGEKWKRRARKCRKLPASDRRKAANEQTPVGHRPCNFVDSWRPCGNAVQDACGSGQ